MSVHGTLKLENRNWKFGFHAYGYHAVLCLSLALRLVKA